MAAVLYGIGARLDERPELLFALRGVNHEELIDTDAEAALDAATRTGKSKRLAAGELSDVFGIEIDAGNPEDSLDTTRQTAGKKAEKARSATKNGKTTAKRKTPKKKSARRPAKKTAAKKKSSKGAVTPKKPRNIAANKSPKKKKKTAKKAHQAATGKRSGGASTKRRGS